MSSPDLNHYNDMIAWNNCHEKGGPLWGKLIAGDSEESTYSFHIELSASGYEFEEQNIDFPGLRAALEGLGLTGTPEAEGGLVTGAVYRLHSDDWHDGDLRRGVGFSFAVNLEQGVIFAVRSNSAKGVGVSADQLAESRIRVTHWSDVVFLHLLRMSYSRPNKTTLNLRYVFRSVVENEEAKSVIRYVLHRKKATLGFWPGVVLTMDDEGDLMDIQTLLGTQNCMGVAYLIFQHRRTLGHKIVHQINIFKEEGQLSDNPSLLLHIRNVAVQ